MESIGLEILDEFARPAVYTTNAGVVSNVRAAIRDRGTRARVGRAIVLTSDAVATVSDAQSWERGATLEQGGSVYRIDGIQVGAPGLMELSLVRVSGAKLESDGIAQDVLDEFGRTINWNGNAIRAHVVRTGVVREIRNGVYVETVKTMVSVAVADVPGIAAKDQVVMGGRVYSVRAHDRDGFGLITLTLD